MSNLLSKASILLTPTATSDGKLHSVKPVQTFGSELVTNGDFASDSNWVLGSGWSIANNKATFNSQGSNQGIEQANIFESGKKYKLTFTVLDYTSGGFIVYVAQGGQNISGSVNSNGDKEFVFINTVGGSQKILFQANSGFSGSIDRVSVKEVTDGDFTFTRATTATRVNSSGLIESVASGLPRIDFLGGTGQILLEPASTNTATYSNDFTQGDIFSGSANPSLNNAVLTANQGTAPDGTNTAFLLKDNNSGGTGQTGLSYFNTFVDSNDFNTFSVFVKKSLSNNFIYLSSGGYDTAASGQSYFNIQDGTLGTISSNHTAKIEDYGSGWYRCSITNKTVTDLQGSFNVNFATSNNTSTITRNGTNGVLLFGLQAEADASRNFATSYIPTSGSTATRNKDEANSSGDTNLINSTEGVLYGELASFTNSGEPERNISLSNSTSNNTAEIGYSSGTNLARFRLRANNVTILAQNSAVSDTTQFIKIAIKYKSGEIKCFINGSQVISDTSSFTFSESLSELAFDRGNGSNEFNGKIKSIAVFKEFLTDAQLVSLTS